MKYKFYGPPPFGIPPYYSPYEYPQQMGAGGKDPLEQLIKFMRWQEAKETTKEKKKKEEEEKKKKAPPPPSLGKAESFGLTMALTPAVGMIYLYIMIFGLKHIMELLHTIN